MKSKINISENIELKILIGRYFEGETTTVEERRLRQLLAQSDDMSEEAEAARAVIGIFAAARCKEPLAQTSQTSLKMSEHRKGLSLWAVISVAASIAVIVAIAVRIGGYGNMLEGGGDQLAGRFGGRNSDSIAMLASGEGKSVPSYSSMALSNGNVRHVDDEDDIADLINTEMGYMAEAERSVEQSVAAEFNSLQGILQ